jgi:hypothetical protein
LKNIKDRLEEQLKKTQNPLQRGFTEKASSKFTAFITAETIALYRKLNMELEVRFIISQRSGANSSFAFRKCSACIPFSSADLPVLSFSIAFITSLQVVGVIGIFVLVEVDIMYENGIQAEHFRNAKEELTPLLCEIINQI